MAKKLSTGELLDQVKTGKLSVDDVLELLKTGDMPVDGLLVLLKTAAKPAFRTVLERAFDALYIYYSRRFYWYLRRRWGFSHEDAEDLVHEVFMLVLKNVHRFDPERGSANAWLWTICHNAAANKRRQIAREANHIVPLPPIDNEDAIFATLPLEEQLEIEKLENAIADCLASSQDTLSSADQAEINEGRGPGRHPRPDWKAAVKRREEAFLLCLDKTYPDWRGNP